MSPRRSDADAKQTRAAILERAIQRASTDGLGGFSLGGLAAELQMSKSGVIRHFPTKQDLQRCALQGAIDIFSREVWQPSIAAPPGLQRLLAVCEAWISYLERDVFTGGCFLTAASSEFDGRPGPVHDAISAALSRWLATLAAEARAAIAAGELPPDSRPEAIAFQLNALAMGANQSIQLLEDRDGARLALGAMRATLGVR